MSIAALCDTETLSFMDEAGFKGVYDRVPEEKRKFYFAAEATILAANDVHYTPALPGLWEQMSDEARTYWRRGYADKLIASVESASAAFGMGEAEYVQTVQRISDWFAGLGWIHLGRPLAETLREADLMHDTAVEMGKAKGARR